MKRDINSTDRRYKDTTLESSAKCGTARRQQTRSATAAGSPSKHCGNPRSCFFVGYLFLLIFVVVVVFVFIIWVLPLGILQIHREQQQSHSAEQRIHSKAKRERCKIRTFAPGSSGICQIQDIYVYIHKPWLYLPTVKEQSVTSLLLLWIGVTIARMRKRRCAGS